MSMDEMRIMEMMRGSNGEKWYVEWEAIWPVTLCLWNDIFHDILKWCGNNSEM